MINYNRYPSLLYLSYDKDNAPTELPFQVSSVSARDYLAANRGYQDLFAIIASMNSLNHEPTHFWLNNKRFKEVEYDHVFRNNHFGNFILNTPNKIQYGCICFKDGGQYVYLYLPADKSQIKAVNGAYLAVALFKENLYIGFEEGIVSNGFSVIPNGDYSGGMDRGGFLSFVAICLSFFSAGLTDLPPQINSTSEIILTKS